MVGKILAMLDNVKGAQFARFTYRAKETKELARHIILLGVDFEKAYTKDIATLEALLPELDAKGTVYGLAGREILASLKESLVVGLGHNSRYTLEDTYVHVGGLKGVSVHKETGVVSVLGFSQDKTVIEPGEYKIVHSAPKTIAKRQIDRQLRRGNIRRYLLPNLVSAAIAGETVDFSHGQEV